MPLSINVSKNINSFILFASILIFAFLPFKRNIWYDESISVLCSKGITYDTKDKFATTQTISEKDINPYNTAGSVFHTTVMDNSNSYLYNIGLHYFTAVAGNSLTAYIIFSRLWGIAALIAIFFLARLLLDDSLFVSAAVVFLATDLISWSMANEIRAYAMGVFFTTLAAIYFFRYLYQQASAKNLLLFGLWAVAAILCHFFTLYVIAVMVVALVYTSRASLFSKNNLIALAIPTALLTIYFLLAIEGFMPKKMHTMVLSSKKESGFSLVEVLHLFARYSAVNFKAVYPRIIDKPLTALLSFLLILVVYIYGRKLSAPGKEGRQKFNLLFVLGISSSLFITVLSLKTHAYSPFYYRYFVFSVPFCGMFVALFLKTVSERSGSKVVSIAFLITLMVPTVYIWVLHCNKYLYATNYNHMAVARKIVNEHITKIEVPEWDDAFLVHCFLPKGYVINYTLNAASPVFTLYNGATKETAPTIVKYPE